MLKLAFIWPFILIAFAGCSSKEMKQESYALPKLPPAFAKNLKPKEKSFVLVGLNDLNAQLKGLEGEGLSIGGAELQERYLSIIENRFEGKNLILSTGHLTQKRSSQNQKKVVYSAVRKSPVHAFGVSSRELEDHQAIKAPLINSNVFEISSRDLLESEHMKSYRIFERAGIKIGVLSVTPPHPQQVLNGLYFEDAVASILKNYQHLENENVDLVTLISHFPSQCETSSPQFEKTRKLSCPETSPLKKILERLPANEIDIVISTGQKFSFGQIDGVYVMNTPGNGLYLDLLRVVYNSEKKQIDHDKTLHFGPILLCESFYQLTDDCFIGNSRERYQKLQEDEFAQTPAYFLGVPIIGK